MTVKGHTLLANNALLFTIYITNTSLENYSYINLLIFYSFFILGVVLVDIDEPKSFIGRKLFFISYPFKIINLLIIFVISFFTKNKSIKRVFEHRGFTHMFIFPVLIFASSFLTNGYLNLYIKLLAFGVLLHQMGDLITNSGIRNYLFPLPFENVKLFITFDTDSFFEKIVNTFLSLLLTYQIFILFNKGFL
jgi:inner membrane protein